jgi:hypothetical protein
MTTPSISREVRGERRAACRLDVGDGDQPHARGASKGREIAPRGETAAAHEPEPHLV